MKTVAENYGKARISLEVESSVLSVVLGGVWMSACILLNFVTYKSSAVDVKRGIWMTAIITV